MKPLNLEPQLEDTESAIKNKLIELLADLKGFKVLKGRKWW